MKIMAVLALTAAASSCSSAGFLAGRAGIGATRFSADEAEEIGTCPEATLGVTFQNDIPAGEPLQGWVGDAAVRLTSMDSDLVDGGAAELDLGARLYPTSFSPAYQPYLGLGVAGTYVHLEDGAAGSADEFLTGLYACAGVELVLGKLRLGLEYRHTFGVEGALGDNPEEQDLDRGALAISVGVGL